MNLPQLFRVEGVSVIKFTTMKNKTLLLAVSLFSVCAVTAPGILANPTPAPATTTAEPATGDHEKKPKMDPAARIDKRVERMTKALTLTADQQKKVRDILTAEMEDARAQRGAGASLSPEERKAKRQEAMEKSRTSVRAVLTPEQQTKFDSMKPGEHRKGPKHDEAGAPAPVQ